ncbi:hypothetical protein JZO66_01880 [Enterococcus sp. DIV0242_7C1]|uniref:hypothetical protein n=1 Tax=Enterococcus TaxID=1350 RepID=UPI00111E5247|nr:hypothetical protein [Enterococcus sp. DIV0242_7C1]MCA5012861.1 hypothetical protein [Enterococcus sp. S23]MCA5016112.1 hypothetical protein [Enterococcus sp. S22(2020)]
MRSLVYHIVKESGTKRSLFCFRPLITAENIGTFPAALFFIILHVIDHLVAVFRRQSYHSIVIVPLMLCRFFEQLG